MTMANQEHLSKRLISLGQFHLRVPVYKVSQRLDQRSTPAAGIGFLVVTLPPTAPILDLLTFWRGDSALTTLVPMLSDMKRNKTLESGRSFRETNLAAEISESRSPVTPYP